MTKKLWGILLTALLVLGILTAAGADELQVKVAAVDAADGENISGAKLLLVNSKGEVEDEWVSAEEAYTLERLEADEQYMLLTDVAPWGYIDAPDTVFSVKADGTLRTEGTVAEDGTILMVFAQTSVTVSTVDKADGSALPGAIVQVMLGDSFSPTDEWLSTGDSYNIRELRTGVPYRLSVKRAPDGYKHPDTYQLAIGTDGKVTYTGPKGDNGELLIDFEQTEVSILAVDTANGGALAGAQLQVLDAWDTVVDTWTSGAAAHKIEKLTTDEEYTLHALTPPEGYEPAEDIKFVLDKNNHVSTTGTAAADGAILAEFTRTRLYSVAVDECEHGTVTAAPSSNLKAGDSVTLYIQPDPGYMLKTLSVGDSSMTENVVGNQLTFDMPASDVRIRAVFQKKLPDLITLQLRTVDEDGKDVDEYTQGSISGAALSNTGSCSLSRIPGEYTLSFTDGVVPAGYRKPADGKITFHEDGTVSGEHQVEKVGGVWMITVVLEEKEKRYAVAVSGGTGSGQYAAGEHVTITAEPPAAKQFKEWAGVDGLNILSGSRTTTSITFVMPEQAVRIHAVWENAPAAIPPRTGDSTPIVLWLAMLAVSGIGMLAVAEYGKRQKHS